MSPTHPSPLGRYDEDVRGPEDEREVRLLRVPVRVMVAGRQHHDELMREMALLALALDEHPEPLPHRLIALVDTLGRRYAASTARPDAEVDAAFERGEASIDLTYTVPAHVVEAADRLAALMAEADEFCRAEKMLTLERTPTLVRFSEWYLDEFRRQVAGLPPRPWDGPLDG